MTNHVYSLADIQHQIETQIALHPSFIPFQCYLSREIAYRIQQLDKQVSEVSGAVQAAGSGTDAHRGGGDGHVKFNPHGYVGKRTPEQFTFPHKHDRHDRGGGAGGGGAGGRERAAGRKSPFSRNTQITEDWNMAKTPKSMIASKEGVEKNITDVRTSLNKISNKNYETHQKVIMDIVQAEIHNHEAIQKIAQFIFDIASTNKFYVEIYADLYRDLAIREENEDTDINHAFITILNEFVNTFKTTIRTIQYVDSNVNYDAFCEYTKANEKQRATASFLVMLMIRNVLKKTDIIETIVFFQHTVTEYMSQEQRTNEVDEITELLSLLITLGKPMLETATEWEEHIVPFIYQMSQYKIREHKGLSSRSLFKYKDIHKSIQK